MPKGKRGPYPEMDEAATDEPTEQPDEQPIQEAAEIPQTAEEFLDATEPAPPIQLTRYVCDTCGGSYTYEEWIEHASVTDHESYELQPIEPPQPEQVALFETEGIVTRYLPIPIGESFRDEERKKLAQLVGQAFAIEDEKKNFDADCNARLKPIKEEMRSLSDSLRRSTVQDWVQCEWRLSEEENARVLVRLDSGEVIDRKALTAEDHQRSVERAAEANAQPVEVAKEVGA